MKKLLLLLLFPTLALAFESFEEKDCTNIDLRNSTLGRVRDQGAISWCYAFTAADMLAYTYEIKSPISAADIALNYNETSLARVMRWFKLRLQNAHKREENEKIPFETGFNKIALQQTIKDGYCPESVFPSERWIKVQNGIETSVPMINAMREISDLHITRSLLTEESLPFFYKFKNIDKVTFLNILKNKKMMDVFSQLRLQACHNDRVTIANEPSIKMVFRNKNIFKTISEQLSLGRVIGVDYDSRILVNHRNEGRKISELHTSSLVGRRWNSLNQTCEFLIRNSHGTNCNSYDPKLECHEGHIWLSSEELYSSMISLVFIQE